MASSAPHHLHAWHVGGPISTVSLLGGGFLIAAALLSFRPEDVMELLIGSVTPVAFSLVFFRARD